MAALIPALVAAGKAAVLGGISGAAGYGVKKGLQAASRKRKINQRPRKDVDSEVVHELNVSMIRDNVAMHC